MPQPKLLTCPECGADSVVLEEHAEAGSTIYRQAPRMMPYVEVVRRHASVGFCTECEFAIEIRRVA